MIQIGLRFRYHCDQKVFHFGLQRAIMKRIDGNTS